MSYCNDKDSNHTNKHDRSAFTLRFAFLASCPLFGYHSHPSDARPNVRNPLSQWRGRPVGRVELFLIFTSRSLPEFARDRWNWCLPESSRSRDARQLGRLYLFRGRRYARQRLTECPQAGPCRGAFPGRCRRGFRTRVGPMVSGGTGNCGRWERPGAGTGIGRDLAGSCQRIWPECRSLVPAKATVQTCPPPRPHPAVSYPS